MSSLLMELIVRNSSISRYAVDEISLSHAIDLGSMVLALLHERTRRIVKADADMITFMFIYETLSSLSHVVKPFERYKP